MNIEIDANGLVPGDVLHIGARRVEIGSELGNKKPAEQVEALNAAYPEHTFRLGENPAHDVSPWDDGAGDLEPDEEGEES